MEEECNLFRDTIEDLKLVYITLGQGIFTWNNKRKGDRYIDSLLDHLLPSESIMESGSEIHCSALLAARSNHWPV